jgi:hypothetical protein
MRHLKKGKLADRAHQYRVMANRLDFHLRGSHYRDRELLDAVNTARDSLLKAAGLLKGEDDREGLRQAS